jgi:type II secretory pathway component PulK
MRIRPKTRERGVAIFIVLFMVSFLLILVMANSKALFSLKREIKLVDQKQKARWAETGSTTNRLSQPNPETKP